MSNLLYYLSISMIIATPITGLILLLDKLIWRKHRAKDARLPWYVDWSDFLFPVVAFVSIVRSFIVEPFTIPSGSMQPTVYAGDMIIANKWSFGLRYPITNRRIFSHPGDGVNRGDIAVFKYPVDTKINYIKRIVALPGDVIDYKINKMGSLISKQITINGVPFKLEQQGAAVLPETDIFAKETIPFATGENTHIIQYTPHVMQSDMGIGIRSFPITVPEGMYFAMGDNRDNSADSRYWGFVPDEYLIGKANFIWMNYNCILKFKDCRRIFTVLQ